MYPNNDKTLKPVSLKTPLGFDYFDYNEIVMIEAKGNTSIVFTLGADSPVKILHSLAFIEKKYCHNNLLRCHKSFIINLFHVENLNLKTHKVQLKKNIIVPLSRECLKMFREISADTKNPDTEKLSPKTLENQVSDNIKIIPLNKIGFVLKEIIKKLKNISDKMLFFAFAAVIMMFCSCEGTDKFYRPNLPEKLSAIGIIDIDDTIHDFSFHPEFDDDSIIIRYVYFEKSFQGEYPEEQNDSIREFSFNISSSDGYLFNFQTNHSIKDSLKIKIPKKIKFITGVKYFMMAKDKETDDISAEVNVPSPPPRLEFISAEKELIPLPAPLEGWEYDHYKVDTLKSALIKISFNIKNELGQFYAIVIGGDFNILGSDQFSGFLDFSVRESNIFGFFAPIDGLKVMQFPSLLDLYLHSSPVQAYFIDARSKSDFKCKLTLSTQFHGPFSNLGRRLDMHDLEKYHSVWIKLLSIPEELYLFEKNLYTYGKIKDDPFSEPVYIRGNIEGGYGVFAICRSTELIVNFDPPY